MMSSIARLSQILKDFYTIRQSSLFDSSWYLNTYPDSRSFRFGPLLHFIIFGSSEGRWPSLFFDTGFYDSQKAANRGKFENPLAHYIRQGWAPGVSPNPILDTNWYVQNVEVDRNAPTPLEHYLNQSSPFKQNPGPHFDHEIYIRDIAVDLAPDMHPGKYFLESGLCAFSTLSRLGKASAFEESNADSSDVDYRIEKFQPHEEDSDVLVLVVYSPDGGVSELQQRLVNQYVAAGFHVVLIINSDSFECHHIAAIQAHTVITRKNWGFDFGAWSHACHILGGLEVAKSVTFTNDSVAIVVPQIEITKNLRSYLEIKADVIFLTENTEVKPHAQSYFFSFSRSGLSKGAINIIAHIPNYSNKDQLIQNVELELEDNLRERGFDVHVVYRVKDAKYHYKNPTIHYWKELVELGFPYFKVQAITSGLIKADDLELVEIIGSDNASQIKDHLCRRDIKPGPVAGRSFEGSSCDQPSPAFQGISGRFNSHGALQAYNPSRWQTRAFQVPFSFASELESAWNRKSRSVLGVVHCFYIDVAETILQEISSTGVEVDLLLTTDSNGKREQLESISSKLNLKSEVVVCPNRGRDVAPMLVEAQSKIEDYDVLFHLHTKKSPHDNRYESWGEYLRSNLIGSREVVLSILGLLRVDDVGFVYSEHFKEVKQLRNWGYDFDHAKDLMARLGVTLTSDMLLDFPTSTMFWARVDALKPLFKIGLSYDDFELEGGQVDGTLAHAIERCLLFIAEKSGYSHVKVVTGENRDLAEREPTSMSHLDALKMALKVKTPRLLSNRSFKSRFYRNIGEIYPVNVAKSQCDAPRLNILLPTLKPKKIFGGITSAIKVASELYSKLQSNVVIRVIVTSDSVCTESMSELSRMLGIHFILSKPNVDLENDVVVDLSKDRHLPIPIGVNDLFFCTAWWTADLGYRLLEAQRQLHQTESKLVYLIQDFEPGFYQWSEKYALAEATYHHRDSTVAIINSEELANFFTARYHFSDCYLLPYSINQHIRERLRSTKKEKIVLVYGRPSVPRNLFHMIVEGLRLWQAESPSENTKYQIVFVGEKFDSGAINELENATVAGKLSLDDYASYLNRAAIGISLMVSPHPSYPPLEMASAGCVTISNNFENKIISERSENIIAMNELTPLALSDRLRNAISMVNIGGEYIPKSTSAISTNIAPVNYNEIASLLR